MTKPVTRPHLKPGAKRKPKKQQKTSAQAIMREKAKALILQYRINGYTFRDILDAVNENFGPDGGEPIKGFRKIRSVHTIHEWCSNAIAEAVDPLKKEELLEIQLAQCRALYGQSMTAALGGSTAHIDAVLKIQDKEARICRLYDTASDETTEFRVFISGPAANL
jgi:hypothetical protein